MKKVISSWDELPLVLDLPLVAQILGFNLRTIQRKAQNSEIPAKKIFDKEWRVEKEELKKFIENC